MQDAEGVSSPARCSGRIPRCRPKAGGDRETSEDLERLRQELTLLYVNAGFLNSGAVLPDQDVRGGVIHYQIVEGRLAEVDVEGNRWFRDGYLRRRILRGAHTPLDVADRWVPTVQSART